MSRVIKFRAWDKSRNEWYGASNPESLTFYGFHVFGECTLLCSPSCEDLQHLVIEQFTGLLDKNGIEIYEGDIVETPYLFNVDEYSTYDGSTIGLYRGVVSFRPSLGFFQKNVVRQEHDGDTHTEWHRNKDLPNVIQSRCSVIGNIHENPELLK